MGESLEELSLREAEATTGIAFRKRVNQMKSQTAFFEELGRSNPSLAKIAASYRESHDDDPGETRSLKFMREGSPYRIHDPTQRQFPIPDWGSEDRNSFDLGFDGGHGGGSMSGFPDVTGVSDGIVGWRMPDIWVHHRDKGNVVTSNLHLGWSTQIPRDGAYIFRNTIADVELEVASRVEGSGLWGIDASLEVEYSAFLSLTGGPALAPVHWTVVNREAGQVFGPQVVSGVGPTAHPLPRDIPFAAQGGQSVYVAINLVAWAWASDDGSVEFSIRKFYCSSNAPDSEMSVELVT